MYKEWIPTSDVDLSVPLDQVLKWEETNLIKKIKYILAL